jgi:diadenosine tetraphosphate (Ap4A) HIT family hydrolase
LFETSNFVVVPTVGALVEGWLLIVPRARVLSFAEVPFGLRSELAVLQRTLAVAIRDCYGNAAMFEHGASKEGERLACGVNHAHRHLLPTPCDLIEGANRMFPGVFDWAPIAGGFPTIASHKSYLHVEQRCDGTGFVATTKQAPSQLFRRVVASCLGVPHLFDWRSDPMEQNVVATIRAISKWCGGSVPRFRAQTTGAR